MKKSLVAIALGALLSAACVSGAACSVSATDGKDGANGADGKSAYEIWLDNGFTGSETDFLNWLRGEDGKDGADGKDGENGKDGADGKDGKDGENGKDGTDGGSGMSAFEIFLQYHPDYTGDEEKWTEEYLVSGGTAVGIASIEKTGEDGLEDTYTVTYTDGTTFEFTVTNGKDGVSAEGVSAAELYEEYKSRYGESITFEEFCKLCVSLEAEGGDSVSAVGSCLLSSMKIYTAFTKTTHSGGWGGSSNATTTHSLSTGSAVIYKMEEEYTYIVTNYHVVYGKGTNELISNEITAYMYGSESDPTETSSGYSYGEYAISCEYVGGAINYDIAVIKARTEDIKAVNPQARAVTLAEGYDVGERVIAIGNTANKGISVTQGVISVDREYISFAIDNTSRQYLSMRMDAMIYEGNSGGGLFNGSGELVGINHAGDTSVTFINNAIPLQTASAVADGIIYYGGATKRMPVGVTVSGENVRYVYDAEAGKGKIVEDVSVGAVAPGSVAESAGVAVGDIICAVSINGVKHELLRRYELGDLSLTVRAGDEVSFEVVRGGEKIRTAAYTVAADDTVEVA